MIWKLKSQTNGIFLFLEILAVAVGDFFFFVEFYFQVKDLSPIFYETQFTIVPVISVENKIAFNVMIHFSLKQT